MTLILYICTAITTVGAAITVISNAAKKAKEPWDVITQRLANVETKLADHERHLKANQERLTSAERESAVMMNAMFALLSHAVDGNETERCREAKIELQDFLANKGVIV